MSSCCPPYLSASCGQCDCQHKSCARRIYKAGPEVHHAPSPDQSERGRGDGGRLHPQDTSPESDTARRLGEFLVRPPSFGSDRDHRLARRVGCARLGDRSEREHVVGGDRSVDLGPPHPSTVAGALVCDPPQPSELLLGASAFHRTVDRSACSSTIWSIPSSTVFCTSQSSRSPFGIAVASVNGSCRSSTITDLFERQRRSRHPCDRHPPAAAPVGHDHRLHPSPGSPCSQEVVLHVVGRMVSSWSTTPAPSPSSSSTWEVASDGRCSSVTSGERRLDPREQAFLAVPDRLPTALRRSAGAARSRRRSTGSARRPPVRSESPRFRP